MASPSSLTADNSSLILEVANASGSSGDYFQVEDCGINTNSVHFLVFGVMSAVVAAREDALHGVKSEAFKAMFKQDSAASTVALLLGHIGTMKGMVGLKPAPETLSRPHFACVNADASKKYSDLDLPYDPWEKCHGDMGISSFHADGTSYIFICSSFFLLPPKPPEGSCPAVRANRFEGDQGALHEDSQVYSLVYDLTRFYLGQNALNGSSIPPEVFDWNKCVFDLNEVESVINPTNMELYVACKFSNKGVVACIPAKTTGLTHRDKLQ